MEKRKQINRSVIVICGVLLGVILIAFGVYQNMNSEYSKLNLPTAEKIQAEIKTSYQEIDNLRKEMLDEYEKHGESAEYGLKSRQIQEKEVLRADLEERLLNEISDFNGVFDLVLNGGLKVIFWVFKTSGVNKGESIVDCRNNIIASGASFTSNNGDIFMSQTI